MKFTCHASIALLDLISIGVYGHALILNPLYPYSAYLYPYIILRDRESQPDEDT